MDPNISADHLETSVAKSAPAAGLVTEGYAAVIATVVHSVHTLISGAANRPFCSWACLG